MKTLIAHVRRNRWLYFRLIPLFGIVLSVGSVAETGFDYSHSFIPLLLFIIILPIVLFFWILAGPDDGPNYPVKELLLFSPMLPISRSTAAIWSYLGILVITLSLAATRDTLSAHAKLTADIFISFSFGCFILIAALGAHAVKRNRLTGRCS
jgi:hypothetical protein